MKDDVVIQRLDERRYAVAVDGIVRYVGSQEECQCRAEILSPKNDRDVQDLGLARLSPYHDIRLKKEHRWRLRAPCPQPEGRMAMATSSNAPDIAKRLLRALVGGGARAGDELKNLSPDGVNLPGVSASDIQAAINYAQQQGSIAKQPGDQYYRLTDAGFRAGQTLA
jgi:hypothetical protein